MSLPLVIEVQPECRTGAEPVASGDIVAGGVGDADWAEGRGVNVGAGGLETVVKKLHANAARISALKSDS